jgi:hypothetical protein
VIFHRKYFSLANQFSSYLLTNWRWGSSCKANKTYQGIHIYTWVSPWDTTASYWLFTDCTTLVTHQQVFRLVTPPYWKSPPRTCLAVSWPAGVLNGQLISIHMRSIISSLFTHSRKVVGINVYPEIMNVPCLIPYFGVASSHSHGKCPTSNYEGVDSSHPNPIIQVRSHVVALRRLITVAQAQPTRDKCNNGGMPKRNGQVTLMAHGNWLMMNYEWLMIDDDCLALNDIDRVLTTTDCQQLGLDHRIWLKLALWSMVAFTAEGAKSHPYVFAGTISKNNDMFRHSVHHVDACFHWLTTRVSRHPGLIMA